MNLFGIFLAWGFIIAGMMIEGSHPSALFDIPAFLIVLGSSIGIAFVQFPPKVVIETEQTRYLLMNLILLKMQEYRTKHLDEILQSSSLR